MTNSSGKEKKEMYFLNWLSHSAFKGHSCNLGDTGEEHSIGTKNLFFG